MNTDIPAQADPKTLQSLHEKVNAMLDIPVPKEGDAFPLPLEATIAPYVQPDSSPPTSAG